MRPPRNLSHGYPFTSILLCCGLQPRNCLRSAPRIGKTPTRAPLHPLDLRPPLLTHNVTLRDTYAPALFVLLSRVTYFEKCENSLRPETSDHVSRRCVRQLELLRVLRRFSVAVAHGGSAKGAICDSDCRMLTQTPVMCATSSCRLPSPARLCAYLSYTYGLRYISSLCRQYDASYCSLAS